MIIVTPVIESHNSCGYIAWTKEFKGTVVQADSKEAVIEELITSLKVMLAHTLNWNINSISAKIVSEKEAKESDVKVRQVELVANDDTLLEA